MLAVAWPPASAGASPSGAMRGSPTPSALLRTGPAARKLAELVLSPEPVEGSKGSNSPRRISEVGCAPRPRQMRAYLQVMVRGLEKIEKKKSLPI